MDLDPKVVEKKIRFDEWTTDFAKEIAQEQRITLTSEHWHVLAIVRVFYEETGISPDMRPLVKLIRTRGNPNLASSLDLMRLFGANPAKAVAALSGLPKPISCL